MALYPMSVKPILKTLSRKDYQKKSVLKSSEKNLKNVVPIPFSAKNFQSVPPSFYDIVEWITNLKPALSSPHFYDVVTPSYVSSSPFRMNYNAKEVKKRFEEWSNLMDIKTRNIIEKDSVVSIFDPDIKQTPRKKKLGTFTVTIEETPTMFLLFLKTRAAIKGSTKGEYFENENQFYINKEFGVKKFSHVGSQTASSLGINRCCGGSQKVFRNKCTNLSLSDIHDTNYLICDLIKSEKPNIKKVMKFYRQKLGKTRIHFNSDDLEEIEDDELSEARKIVSTIGSEEFFRVSILINRILERNINPQIKLNIKKPPEKDPLAEKIDVRFKVIFLQKASFHKVWCLPVTSISLNETNNNLFAVGHGKLFSNQPAYLGRVNLWNVKSLSAPEKTLDFKSGVTSVSFSRLNPYALLVSFLTGHIAVINISQRTPVYIINEENNPSNFSPIWQASWFYNGIKSEIIVTCGGDGLINGYYTKTFEKILIASLTQESDLEGIKVPCEKVSNEKIILKPNVFCIASSIKNKFKYLAGTDDGSIHQFSTEFKQKLDSFQGHHGPVHQIKYHPDTRDVFFSLGIDFCVRIWTTKIKEPIITLTVVKDHIQHADWSPTHPTIIATVAGNFLSIWDIRVSSIDPCVSFESPTKSKFTTVQFLNGDTVLCGDIYGDTLILGLRDLPFAPTLKVQALGTCIYRLVSDTHLGELLRISGFPYFVEEKDELYFNC